MKITLLRWITFWALAGVFVTILAPVREHLVFVRLWRFETFPGIPLAVLGAVLIILILKAQTNRMQKSF